MNGNAPYTETEDDIIRAGFAAGKTDSQIALDIGGTRTIRAIKNRRCELRLLREGHPGGSQMKNQVEAGNYWTSQTIASQKFAEALRKSGATPSICTEPQTSIPRVMRAETIGVLRSSADF